MWFNIGLCEKIVGLSSLYLELNGFIIKVIVSLGCILEEKIRIRLSEVIILIFMD